jgi:hypothetical protein
MEREREREMIRVKDEKTASQSDLPFLKSRGNEHTDTETGF